MKNKGITLIALVITIIVLLILAGISIATLTGENGILTQAQQAKKTTKAENDMEIIKMAWTTEGMAYLSDTYPDTGEVVFLEELKKTDENATIDIDSGKIYIYYNDDNYIFNIYTMEIVQEEKLTPEQLEERAMEMLVDTTDKIVVLPIPIEYRCTIDWGDGCTTTNEGKTASKEEVKVASTKEGIKVAAMQAPTGISHQYEKDGEYTVKIKGQRIYGISYCACYFENTGYFASTDNLLEIIKWGEVELKNIDLEYHTKLIKIASPGENSFKDLKYCSFKDCTGLTGTVPEIWKLGTNNETNKYKGTPDGKGCFAGCTQLENYGDIPDYWK